MHGLTDRALYTRGLAAVPLLRYRARHRSAVVPPKKIVRRPLTARTADRHKLYQRAVQTPEADVSFISRTFKALRGRPALSLREDFCGTAHFSSAWVASNPQRTAIGVDLDESVQAWGMEHNVAPLGADSVRVKLVPGDVLHTRTPRVDVNVAFNFSFWVFKSRALLLSYFRAARRNLKRDGLFFMDMHGGTESMDTLSESKPLPGYRYVWEHKRFDIVSHDVQCAIHFEFKDGTRMNNAFTYDWRFWTLPEVLELLGQAGFSEVKCYFEGTERGTTHGNGVFSLKDRCSNDPSWIAYVVAAP